MLSYSWFVVTPGDDNGTEIMNETAMMYIITDPMYDQNATGYYCTASNDEGIAVSDTSTLIGNKYLVTMIKQLLWTVPVCRVLLPILYVWPNGLV